MVQACDERHVAGVLRRDGVTECTASSPPPLRLTLIPMRPPPSLVDPTLQPISSPSKQQIKTVLADRCGQERRGGMSSPSATSTPSKKDALVCLLDDAHCEHSGVLALRRNERPIGAAHVPQDGAAVATSREDQRLAVLRRQQLHAHT